VKSNAVGKQICKAPVTLCTQLKMVTGHTSPSSTMTWDTFFASVGARLGLGDDPDAVIGDPTFLSVADEVYKFLTKNPNARLTDKQIEELMTAVLRKCRDAGKKIKVSPFYLQPGRRGVGYGLRGVPWWMYALGDFLNWLDSIQVPKKQKPEEDHLA
jgi:hypothetical protein